MKNLILFLLLLTNSLQAQIHPKKLEKFVEQVNLNLKQIQSQRLELKSNGAEGNETDWEVIHPNFNYDFEILEPFSINSDGEISMKLKYLKPEDAFYYSIKAELSDLVNYGVDIFFILNFNPGSLSVQYEYLESGKINVYEYDYLHLGIDHLKMVTTAKKAGISEGYFYP